MLKRHNQSMLAFLVIGDAIAVVVAWLASYWIRFEFLPVDPIKGVPGLSEKFLPMLPAVVLAHLIIFARVRLYRPRRGDRPFRETRDVFKAFFVAVAIVIVIDYVLPETYKISRWFVATYAIVGTLCFAVFRATVRLTLQAMRRRGYNQRTAAIIGSGRNAQHLLFALQRSTWTGFRVSYFVDDLARGSPRATPRRAGTGTIGRFGAHCRRGAG